MPPRVIHIVLLLSSGLTVSCTGKPEPEKPTPQPPSHDRMVRVLREISDRDKETSAEYLRRARSMAAQLPASTPDETRLQAEREIGNYLLVFGHNEEALRHLQAAYELLPKLRGKTTRETYVDTLYDLAIGHLRVAETENCVQCETGESCVFPIRASGVHEKKRGSRGAVEALEELLSADPGNLKARWLLNVAYMTLGEYPAGVPRKYRIDPKTFESDEDFPRFSSVAKKLGLDSYNMSGGAICDDFDGDGDLDIVTSDWGASGQMLFFRNNGDGSFSNRTSEAGLTGILGGLNLLQADYDNDGDLDVLALRGAWLEKEGHLPNSLLRNDGKARFSDVSFEAGIAGADFPTQTASWGDYDLDGFLDLFVGNEHETCQLFHNNGDGTFRDVAEEAGISEKRFTKGVIWGDFDGDRYPDVYVSNWDSANQLYRNNGDGTFTDVAEKLGVTKPLRSFPVWFWDFDNDGHLDLWVSSAWWDLGHLVANRLGHPTNAELACLYRGRDDGTFEEVAASRNLTELTIPMGSNFGDLDNDGYLDFYLGTGYPSFEGLMPNVMYRNRAGKSFADVTTAGGFGHLQKGHGISFADLDHDGDADIFSQMGGAFPADAFKNALYENPGFGAHWIKVRLVGTKSNRFGIGARIKVDVVSEAGSGARTIYRHVNSGGSFGANPLRQEVGLGDAARIVRLDVFWPRSNSTQTFRDLAVDQAIEITEGAETFRTIRLARFSLGGSDS